jgi:hypothetical protein
MTKSTVIKFGIALGFLVAFGAYKVFKIENPCATPPERHVVIIDATDPLGTLTVEGIKSTVKVLTEKAAVGSEFKIVLLGGDPPASKSETACRPDTNPISNPQNKIDREWKTFSETIFGPIDKRPTSSPSSPIYETILDESRTAFQGFSGKKVLVVISDWRQYSPNKTNLHHGCDDPTKTFTNLSESLLVRVSASTDRPLAGVTVYRLVIPREDMNEKFTKCVLQVADMFINAVSGQGTTLPESWKVLARSPSASK